MGCKDRELALVQHITRLSSLLFRQDCPLGLWKPVCAAAVSPPKVMDLALLALEQEEAGWSLGDRDKEELAGHVVDLLQGKKEMLADYCSLEFEMDSLHLTGLPLLLDELLVWRVARVHSQAGHRD